MQCENCEVFIDQKFEFAIRSNNCPACGKDIMRPEKLVAYVNLKELIKNNFSDIDVDKIVNLVIANFELKQLFKESVSTPPNSSSNTEIIKDSNDDISDEEFDRRYKEKQKQEVRKLKDMKEEVYREALKAQYGMGEAQYIEGEAVDETNIPDTGGFFNEENISEAEAKNRLEQATKQSMSQNNMLSGIGGFKRSDV